MICFPCERENDYKEKLVRAGFEDVEVAITRIYDLGSPDMAGIVPGATADELVQLNGVLASAFIRAKKPS